MELRVSAQPEVLARLRVLAQTFPKELARAQYRAASIVVRKIRSAMRRGGNQDTGRLAPLSPLRLALRPATPMGGVLNTEASSLVRVQRRGGVVYAGFISDLDGVFSRWQMGGRVTLSKPARAHMHRMLRYGGMPRMEIPEEGEQPARPVIGPIARVAADEYPRWVEGAFYKQIHRTLGRAGA